jgi:flagellar biosynthetic protein FliR
LLILFALVLARVGGLLLGAPVFSGQALPLRFRTVVVVVLATTLLPVAHPSTLPQDGYAVAVALVGEMAIGFALGMLARLLLTAFQLAGGIIAFQMGFAMARTLEPSSGMQTTVIATLHLQLVTLLFFFLDGHHLLIRGLAASYDSFPIGASLETSVLSQSLFSASGLMFEIGARVAGPVTGVMLLINALIGFLNRIVPQLSIFNIGFPLTVMSGLVAVALSIPETVAFFLRAYESFEGQLAAVLLR